MTPSPTGRLVAGEKGPDLVLTRSFRAPIEDVWASITEPERTARWFVDWSGEAGPGKTVRTRMMFEEGQPEGDLTIEACEPPHLLAVTTTDESGTWRMEARLSEEAGTTLLTLVHHLEDPGQVVGAGAGWEYYLDMLVAYRAGRPLPDFGDYYPGQQAYYEGLAAERPRG